MSPRLMPALGGAASGVPAWTAAGNQHLVHAGDSTNAKYSSATAAGASGADASVRFVPDPSPWVNSTPVDATWAQIVAGKGGSGKALVNTYVANGSAVYPRWYLDNHGAVSGTKTCIVRCQMKLPSLTSTSYITSKNMQFEVGGTGAQFSIRTKWPAEDFFPGYSNGYLSPWCPIGPTGYDPSDGNNSTQPIGPYPSDITDYHEFVFSEKQDSAIGVHDGHMRMWIKGAATSGLYLKVLDTSSLVTPSGALKPYSSAQMIANSLNVLGGIRSNLGISFGGDTSGTPALESRPWSQYINIGDGDPTNTDTFAFWYED